MSQHISDKDRPDEAFTTDRAVRSGRANAASGRIMVTVPGDHFGPIPPEADPRGQVCRRSFTKCISRHETAVQATQCQVIVLAQNWHTPSKECSELTQMS